MDGRSVILDAPAHLLGELEVQLITLHLFKLFL